MKTRIDFYKNEAYISILRCLDINKSYSLADMSRMSKKVVQVIQKQVKELIKFELVYIYKGEKNNSWQKYRISQKGIKVLEMNYLFKQIKALDLELKIKYANLIEEIENENSTKTGD